jgi:hypothetical protein
LLAFPYCPSKTANAQLAGNPASAFALLHGIQRIQPYIQRVAIAQAVAEKLGPRQGSNQYEAKGAGNISGSTINVDTRDLAAAKAGLGCGKTYEAAKNVVMDGAPVASRSKGVATGYPLHAV